MPQLRNITISTTLTCNEACAHCWVSAGPRRSEDMATGLAIIGNGFMGMLHARAATAAGRA
jgi:hypothetical protein